MTPADAARVLAKAAAFDQRTVGEADVRAWHEALSDLDAGDALAAVTRHYRQRTERIMPAHVRDGAVEIAKERYLGQVEAGPRPPEFQPPNWPRVTAMLAELRRTLPPGRKGVFGRQLLDTERSRTP